MGDSSVLVLYLVFPVEETMTHVVICFQALSWAPGCSPAWMATADEERKSQVIVVFGIDDQPLDAPFCSDLRHHPKIVHDDAPPLIVVPV
jgi:hypothetical protein